MKTNRQCIYAIVNIITFDSYIGSSKSYPQRWADHRRSLRTGVHQNKRLQKAWDKHGEGLFVFNVLERVDGDEAFLREREQFYLDSMRPKYNIRLKTSGRWYGEHMMAYFESIRGVPRPPDVAAKIAANNRERAANNKRLGIPHPKPTKGKIWTDEERANSSRASKGKNLGRVLPEESRNKISVAHKARFAAFTEEDWALWKKQHPNDYPREPISDETRAKLAAKSTEMWAEAKSQGLRIDGVPLRRPDWYLKHPDATCTECGVVLVPKPGRRFTCSDECRLARNKRRVQSGAYSEDRECVECEASFTVSVRTKDTETCSKKCAALRWRREEREERTVDGNLMCRKNLHVIDSSDVRCPDCYKIERRERYHRSVADIPRRSWSHDGPRSGQRKIVG